MGYYNQSFISLLFIIIFVFFCSAQSEILSNSGKTQFLKSYTKVTYKDGSNSRHENIKPDCIPGSPEDVHFYLYTKNHPRYELKAGNTTPLRDSQFLKQASLKFLIHGFGGSFASPFPMNTKDAYMNTIDEINILLVDWKKLAEPPLYESAVQNTGVVANETTKLILFLLSENVTSLDKIHFVGHSLGAQISGNVGYTIQQFLSEKISRISGLDPARPLFELVSHEGRLDRDDATFVDVIHTSALGFYQTMGQIDFYPNRGVMQPGCYPFDVRCDHSKAHEYFTKTIYEPTKFKGCKCPHAVGGFPIIIPESCRCNETNSESFAFMGNYASQRSSGVFYLKT